LRRLRLRHPQGTTHVVAGTGAFGAATPDLRVWLAGRAAFVITTPRVMALHGAVVEALGLLAGRLVVLEVEEGEAAKTLARAGTLWERLLAEGGKRDSRVVAFGGGSVGDLAGFVAACFLRGVEVAQLPTTVLAQVDASIGGKTAIDLPQAKNSVGAFHHPAFVVSDAAWLATLPADEVRSGLVEAVKMAALLDLDLLSAIERDLDALLAGEPEALGAVVAGGAAAKVGIVERDPDERGERALLNFGHTLGHALETASGYAGLKHGEAVAWGILFALRLAERRGLDPAFADRLRRLIGRLGLPPMPPCEAAELVRLMARDKKAREHGLDWVLPVAPGRGELVQGIPVGEIEAELAAFLAGPGR
jgi:3-dehydroquinate synthase